MIFSSSVFLFLFLPMLLIFYFLPVKKFIDTRKYRNFILLLASVFFYWWGDSTFVFIMLFSIAVNWWLGLRIDKDRKNKKKYVTVATVYDLGILFIFKYLGFFTFNIAQIIGNDSIIVELALPIGISFFTFQMLSYVLDVANDTAKCQKSFFDVALYIVMFPQLIAGPIVRYETVANEIQNREENFDEFSEGMCRFIKGLAKKVILANNFAVLADLVFDGVISEISVITAWIGALAYTLQIFYDFSGYSDMAIGLGKIFGFHFLENFNFPYISKSISEFWRRWHISMGTFFRDYVYFPLGGSKVEKKWKVYRNLFIVWLLTGIWHGANWTFIIWGLMYGLLICFEKLIGFEKQTKKLGILSNLYTMFFVIIGWVIFRADSLGQAGLYLSAMFGRLGNPVLDNGVQFLKQFAVYFILGILFALPIENIKLSKCDEKVTGKILYVAGTVGVFVIAMAFVTKGGYNPFIYFNF